MFLNKMSFGTVLSKQFNYKLNAYMGVFTSLVVVQIIAILFSFSGSGSSNLTSSNVSIHAIVYSNSNVVMLTFLWIIAHAIMMTTKAEREHSFTFVSNHLSNHYSNALFLLLASTVAGITTILSDFCIRVIIHLFGKTGPMIGAGLDVGYQLNEVLYGIITIILYYILVSSIGYLLGVITQLHRMLPVLLPILVIGILIMIAQIESDVLLRIIQFYSQETNFIMFLLKTLITSILCFLGTILLSYRLEERP